MNICDYTTLASVKTYRDSSSSLSAPDALLLAMIRQSSRDIEDISNRWFYPRIETHLFDTPRGLDLVMDADLLEVTSLTNGDGTVISSSNYVLYPLNQYPKIRLTLLPVQYAWQLASNSGAPYAAISLAGLWGYSANYGSAWIPVTSLSTAISSSSQTTVTVPTGIINSGDLLKIESEFVYVSAVTVGATDTLTLVRGVNGSTAAASHAIGVTVNRWDMGSELNMLVTRAAVAYAKLRSNPTGETINVDGMTFNTPKDVLKWEDQQLRSLGLCRPGIG